MKPVNKLIYLKRRGAVLIISMIFVLVFAALAVSMASLSGVNLQIADNQRKGNHARASAESGLDILRFWLARVYMPGTTATNDRFNCLATRLQNDLTDNGISNIPIATDINIISIGGQENPVVLNSSTEQRFSAKIQPTDNINLLQMDITGYAGQIKRTIRVNYNFGTRAHTVFDYGVATKGALKLQGTAEIGGIDLDAGVYIESESDANALTIIGNSHIAGDVDITNPNANVTLQGGQASIGGETGQAAIDNHVEFGVPPVEFPVPIPTYFEHYVTNTFDPNKVEDEYENVRIPTGIGPVTFASVTLRGVIFIEAPNIVTFTGNTTITGIIVGNGSLSDNSGINLLSFLGTVDSHPVTELLGEEFAELREETGTFILAPGFSASFLGDFTTLNGAIAANGITFDGDAGGTINGSVINYSNELMELYGNTNLIFNRSGTTQIPAGFGPEIILHYLPEFYCEVIPDL